MREFLKLNKFKIAFTASLLIIFVAIILFTFFLYSSNYEETMCELDRLGTQYYAALKANDSMKLNQTEKEFVNLNSERINYDALNNIIIPTNKFFEKVAPMHPMPCLFEPSSYAPCYYSYESKKSRECATNIIFKEYAFRTGENTSGYDINGWSRGRYKSPIGNLILEFIYLAVIGYLVSCILNSIYDSWNRIK